MVDANEAEAWAIWQALNVISENAHFDWSRVKRKLRDPCKLAIIYSDSKLVLQRFIKGKRRENSAAELEVISQTHRL